jgi:glycerol-3-phosphate dehydrogenase
MKRDPRLLAEGRFDVLVIGGGIYGAWTAYDAALRGLKVALIEKRDWASGTSSASSKLIHGGLRYLEQMHFGLVKRSLEERGRLARLAPHRVAPLRFLIPVYRHSRVGRLRLQAGLWLYDRLATGDQPVAPHESLSAQAVQSRWGYVRREHLRGGFTYGDCLIDDAHFTLEIVAGACDAGATAANYVRATGLLVSHGVVEGASVVDERTGDAFDVRASVTINATGMWPLLLDAREGHAPRLRLSKGVHLVLPRLPSDDAILALCRRDTRVLFVIPWYGKTLLGTTDADYDGDPEDVRAGEAEIDYLLDEARAVIGEPQWDRSMIEGIFAGVRALKYESGKSPSRVTREWVLESPSPGLLVSIGGKFTSARADAAAMVDRAFAQLKRSLVTCRTADRRFPWAPEETFAAWKETVERAGVEVGLDAETAGWIARRYGSRAAAIHRLIEDQPALAGRIDSRLPFALAEIVFGARDAMAVTLEDLLRRRTPILILSRMDGDVIERAANAASSALGWDARRRQHEIDGVRRASATAWAWSHG